MDNFKTKHVHFVELVENVEPNFIFENKIFKNNFGRVRRSVLRKKTP